MRVGWRRTPQALGALLAPALLVAAAGVWLGREAWATSTEVDGDEVVRVLAQVASVRGLPARTPPRLRVLGPSQLDEALRAQVAKELPPELARAQGEALVALGMVSPAYDFAEGGLALLGQEVAGFYDPDTRTMVLRADLPFEARLPTLAHELVHALQDGLRPLGPLLHFRPGQGDAIAAVHALVEGDATDVMFRGAVTARGEPAESDLRELERSLMQGQAPLVEYGEGPPPILRRALGAPYLDGLRLVRALRQRFGQEAIDALLRDPPASTEQLLHLDKLEQREAPLPVPRPGPGPLGQEAEVLFDDVLGEQGLRLLLEEWLSPQQAARAAAGWGGDRYVVYRRGEAEGGSTQALVLHLRMDTEADRRELEQALEKRYQPPCQERATLGPLAWGGAGDSLVLIAGPYRRLGASTHSAAQCVTTEAWAAELLSSSSPSPSVRPKR